MTGIPEKKEFKTQEQLHEEAKIEEEKRVAAGTNLRDARGQVLKAPEKPKDDGKIRDARG